jgi:hypothetical protein
MKRTIMIPAVLLALVAMAILAPAVEAKGGQRIVLRPAGSFPAAKGSAKLQTAGQRELEVEVEHIRRLAGKRVSFWVNSTKIGSSRVSGLGAARIDRRGSSFPAVGTGTKITVKTAAGGKIVSGRF